MRKSDFTDSLIMTVRKQAERGQGPGPMSRARRQLCDVL